MQDYSLNNTPALLSFSVIMKISLIYTADNSSSKFSKHLENPFVEQAKIVKKRKVETDFEKENYIVSLRRAIDVLGGKYTMYVIEKYSITNGYNYTAN